MAIRNDRIKQQNKTDQLWKLDSSQLLKRLEVAKEKNKALLKMNKLLLIKLSVLGSAVL